MLYRTKVYSVKQDHSIEYLADGIVSKKPFGPAMDPVGKFYYTLITQDFEGNISGINEDTLKTEGQILAVFKNDLVKENKADPGFVKDYAEEYFEISPIREQQEAITENRRIIKYVKNKQF